MYIFCSLFVCLVIYLGTPYYRELSRSNLKWKVTPVSLALNIFVSQPHSQTIPLKALLQVLLPLSIPWMFSFTGSVIGYLFSFFTEQTSLGCVICYCGFHYYHYTGDSQKSIFGLVQSSGPQTCCSVSCWIFIRQRRLNRSQTEFIIFSLKHCLFSLFSVSITAMNLVSGVRIVDIPLHFSFSPTPHLYHQ